MRKSLLVLCCALASPSFAGWFDSAPPGHIPPDRLAAIHSIAAVPALNHELIVEEIGATVFDYRETYLPTGEWLLDDVAVETVETTLGARIKVVRSELSASEFREPEARYPLEHDLFEPAEDVAADENMKEADAYLIVNTFNEFGGNRGSPNPSVYGLGIHKRDGLFGTGVYSRHVLVSLTLIDAKTGVVLAAQKVHQPWRALDKTDWADTADALTPDQVADLKRGFTTLLADGISGALGEMGLSDGKR